MHDPVGIVLIAFFLLSFIGACASAGGSPKTLPPAEPETPPAPEGEDAKLKLREAELSAVESELEGVDHRRAKLTFDRLRLLEELGLLKGSPFRDRFAEDPRTAALEDAPDDRTKSLPVFDGAIKPTRSVIRDLREAGFTVVEQAGYICVDQANERTLGHLFVSPAHARHTGLRCCGSEISSLWETIREVGGYGFTSHAYFCDACGATSTGEGANLRGIEMPLHANLFRFIPLVKAKRLTAQHR